MTDTRYRIYRQSVIDFTKTLVIKSELAAESINKYLISINQEVELDFPDTWKYYNNLAGQYHFTDTPMSIVSLDTLETIPFTIESLEIHKATKRNYAYGSRYYNELLAKYPTQEQLIRGILNPVDIDVAINAAEGTILYYDAEHIEENEYDLLGHLQKWIYNFCNRWNVRDYRHSDDLYPAAVLALLYSAIPGVILTHRTSCCKTNQAHSYHIREFLASHGGIDQYMDILSKRQSLFLYRNIEYINHNVGLESTFQLLVKNLLTDRNIPLSSYEMRHNTKLMPASIKPAVEFVQYPLNLQHVEGRDDVLTTEQLLDKIKTGARDNALFFNEDVAATVDVMDSAIADRLKTKVLESIVVDSSDDAPFTFAETLLNHWVYLACNGRYKAVVSFTNPIGGEPVILSAVDAFTLYLYALSRTVGITFINIPEIEALLVRRMPTPTIATLRKITDRTLITTAQLQALLTDVSPIPTILSNDKFFDVVNEIHQRLLKHRVQYSNIDHFMAQGGYKAAALHLYCDQPCKLSAKATYAAWFDDLGLVVTNWSDADFQKVSDELLTSATGVKNNNAKTIRDIQEGTIKLLAQLSSYTLNFITTINTEPVRSFDWTPVTLGDIGAAVTTNDNMLIEGIVILDMQHQVLITETLDFNKTLFADSITTRAATELLLDSSNDSELSIDIEDEFFIPMGDFGIMEFESITL